MIDQIFKSAVEGTKLLGLSTYLALFLSIGVFLTALFLVRFLIRTYERERQVHQQFLSDAVKSNTAMIGQVVERMNDLGNLITKILESLTRLENADRYQREEHKQILLALENVKGELGNLHDQLKG